MNALFNKQVSTFLSLADISRVHKGEGRGKEKEDFIRSQVELIATMRNRADIIRRNSKCSQASLDDAVGPVSRRSLVPSHYSNESAGHPKCTPNDR